MRYQLLSDDPMQDPSVQPESQPQAYTVACIDLYHSHALDRIGALLQSFNEGFVHCVFDASEQQGLLIDEYANNRFRVAYLLREEGHDQIQVRWAENDACFKGSDTELLALARQIASLLGGGTNLRFWEAFGD
jgi:hypothetical protein